MRFFFFPCMLDNQALLKSSIVSLACGFTYTNQRRDTQYAPFVGAQETNSLHARAKPLIVSQRETIKRVALLLLKSKILNACCSFQIEDLRRISSLVCIRKTISSFLKSQIWSPLQAIISCLLKSCEDFKSKVVLKGDQI